MPDELHYDPYPSGDIVYFRPKGPFVVDGIVYSWLQTTNTGRPMIELLPDHRCEDSDDCPANEKARTGLYLVIERLFVELLLEDMRNRPRE